MNRRFKRFLKALRVAFLGFFYDVRISRKGRVFLWLRNNKEERRIEKRIKKRYTR